MKAARHSSLPIESRHGARPRHAIGLVKPTGEVFLWIYDPTEIHVLLQALGRAAENPDLDFEWRDAAILAAKSREEANREKHA